MARFQNPFRMNISALGSAIALVVLLVVVTAGGSNAAPAQPQNVRIQDGTSSTLAKVLSGGSLSVSIANFPSATSVSGAVEVTNFPSATSVSGAVEVTNFPSSTVIGGDRIPPSALGRVQLVGAPIVLSPGEESHTLHAIPGGREGVFWFQATGPLAMSINEVLPNMAGRAVFTASSASRVEAFRWILGSDHVTFDLKNNGGSTVSVTAGWLMLVS
jgi:hypothetical protein